MNDEFSRALSGVSDFQHWGRGVHPGKASAWGYVRHAFDVSDAVALASIFWPDLVEYRGCVVLAEHFDRVVFETWWRHFHGNIGEIEQMLNHTHVYDLFSGVSASTDPMLYEAVGRVMRSTWPCKLKAAYPDKEFDFYYGTEPTEYGPTLSFWQHSGSTQP